MNDPLYKSNTRARLAAYRAKASDPRNIRPDAANWRYWKPSKGTLFAAPNNVRGPEGQIYSDTIGQYGEELSARADDRNCGLRHSGWYADNFQNELIEPRVCRMRSARGTLYIPATRRTECDGTQHYIKDAELVPRGSDESAHDAAIRDAMRTADHYAEREAEDCREDDAKYQAEQQTEDCREEIHQARDRSHDCIQADVRDELLETLQGLEDCARLVIERTHKALKPANIREMGDLADAVRSLSVDADRAHAAIAKATGVA